MWENTTPSTELPRDFCAGIGPLQLGVVLVKTFFYMYYAPTWPMFMNRFKGSIKIFTLKLWTEEYVTVCWHITFFNSLICFW